MDIFDEPSKSTVKFLQYNMSRVLFIVLIGCAVALGSPVRQEAEGNTGVSSQQQVEQAIQKVLVKIGEAVGEVLRALFNLIQQGLNSEEINNAVQNLKTVLEKAFNQGLEGDFDLADKEDIQKALKNLVKRAVEAYKGFLTKFFNKIEEQVNDEELKKSIQELKQLLEQIYKYEAPQNKRSLNAEEDENVQQMTREEVESISNGFKEIFQKIIEAILKQLGEQLSEEEKQELKEALQGIHQSIDF